MSRSSTASPRRDTVTGLWGFAFDSEHPGPEGRRRQVRRRGFPTKAAARAELDRLRADDRLVSSHVDNLTVADVLNQFVTAKAIGGRAPGTVEQYRWAAARACEEWGTWPAARLTGNHLEVAYLGWMVKGRRVHHRGKGTKDTASPLSSRSVEIIHKTIRAAFQLAVDKGHLPRNPARLASRPHAAEQQRRWWTPQQVGTFLVFCRRQSDLPSGLVEVLADAGGRRGEVLGLRWSDFDLDNGTASITRQLVARPRTNELELRNTKRPRSKSTIGLHPDTVKALRTRRSAQAEHRLLVGSGWPGPGTLDFDLVFTWPDGRAIRPDVLTRTIARLSVAAGLPRITPHGLRHSFASAALAARVPVEVVAARLGNTPRVVQEIYAHVIPADDQAAAQLVGDLYRSKEA